MTAEAQAEMVQTLGRVIKKQSTGKWSPQTKFAVNFWDRQIDKVIEVERLLRRKMS